MELSVINEFESVFPKGKDETSSSENQLECQSKNVTKELPLDSLKEEEEAEIGSNRLFPLMLNGIGSGSLSEPECLHRPHALQSHVITESNRRLGDRNTGLNKKYCRQIKKLKVSKTSQSCSICQQAFLKDELIVQLPCKHIFHKKGCLTEWLKVSVNCPICKLNLEEHFRSQEPIQPLLQ